MISINKEIQECSKIKSLMKEFLNDWNELNIAAKCLMYIGLFIFICTIFITLYIQPSNEIIKSIESVFRTCLASIFGYFFSSNIRNKNKSSDLDNRSNCIDEINKYNFKDGNLIQICLAFFICMVCMFIIFMAYVHNLTHNIAALSQLRDLMCTSIGFLSGEAKIKKS